MNFVKKSISKNQFVMLTKTINALVCLFIGCIVVGIKKSPNQFLNFTIQQCFQYLQVLVLFVPIQTPHFLVLQKHWISLEILIHGCLHFNFEFFKHPPPSPHSIHDGDVTSYFFSLHISSQFHNFSFPIQLANSQFLQLFKNICCQCDPLYVHAFTSHRTCNAP